MTPRRYRRKTANARERSRMREINEAFEALRRAVPHLAVDAHNEKLTKITTLRLAMKYISALSGLLSTTATAATSSTAVANSCGGVATSRPSPTCNNNGPCATSLQGSSASSSSSVPPDLAALGCLSPSTSDDVDSLLSEYASDLLGGCGAGSECSSAASSSVGCFLAAADHHSAAFLRDLSGAAAAAAAAAAATSYSLSPSSCSTSATDVAMGCGGGGGFSSPLLPADFPVDVAAAFMPFADHPLPPIDFNGDPYMFEDNFACTEFS